MLGLFLSPTVSADEAPTVSQEPPVEPLEATAGDIEAESDETAGRIPRFGGPDQVENQLRANEEAENDLFERYSGWKAKLAEEHGLSFSVDYSSAWLSADESPAEDDAAGGMVRLYGSWDLTGGESGNTGALVWKVEQRHKYSETPPGDFGLNIGYVGLFEPPFSNQSTRLTNLYWRQRLNGGKLAIVGGWLDSTDYVDVYALASPWTGFMNFAFSSGSAAMAVPNEGLGIAAAAMVTDNIFLIGGLADANSDPADPGAGFDTFFTTGEYFKHIEVGYTPAHDQIYLDNVHLTYWHADERVEAATPGGWGLNFSYTTYLAEKWLPFVRAGYTEDGGSLLERSVSFGFGYQPIPAKNLLGMGFNWGRPNASTFQPGLDDQRTMEIFYRWRPVKEFELTPDIQYLKNPALNPDQSSIWVFGLRARLIL